MTIDSSMSFLKIWKIRLWIFLNSPLMMSFVFGWRISLNIVRPVVPCTHLFSLFPCVWENLLHSSREANNSYPQTWSPVGSNRAALWSDLSWPLCDHSVTVFVVSWPLPSALFTYHGFNPGNTGQLSRFRCVAADPPYEISIDIQPVSSIYNVF